MRRGCSSGAAEAREMASETGIDEDLFAVVGFGEFEEEDSLFFSVSGMEMVPMEYL